MTDKTIRTAADVFDHFGADYDPEKSLEENNRRLSRRIYKDTNCGAWGKVEERKATQERHGYFSAEYVKLDGVWTFLRIRRHDDLKGPPVENIMVPNTTLHDYFWDKRDLPMLTVWLEDMTRDTGRSAYTTDTEFLSWSVPTDDTVVKFRCGSIVEGVDAEVNARPVTLPCSPEDFDAAIQYVEDEVQRVWMQTHGCDGCEKLAEKEHGKGCWSGQVMTDCPECDGDGVSI